MNNKNNENPLDSLGNSQNDNVTIEVTVPNIHSTLPDNRRILKLSEIVKVETRSNQSDLSYIGSDGVYGEIIQPFEYTVLILSDGSEQQVREDKPFLEKVINLFKTFNSSKPLHIEIKA